VTRPTARTHPPRVVLESFGIPPESPVATPERGGFSGAQVFRVDAGAATWCLKAIPTHQVDLIRQEGLQRLLAHLADGGLDFVPVPRLTRSGERWVVIGGTLWQCEPWLPGQADLGAHVSTARLTAGLRALGLWHQRAVSFAPRPTERPWFRSHHSEPSPAVRERSQLLQHWSPGRLNELESRVRVHWPRELHPAVELIIGEGRRQGPEVLRILHSWCNHPVAIQPCLRDIWREHLLFVGNRVTGLIDPQACRSDSVAVDLARLLGSLCGNDQEGWRTGLAAYGQVRPLSLDELQLVSPLDRAGCLLAGLHWLERLSEREPHATGFSAAATGRLWHFAERLAGGSTDGGLTLPLISPND